MPQRLVLAYKNFAAHQNISHIGLGVSALNTCKVLRRGGVIAGVWPVVNAKDLRDRLQRDPATHVVISAPWLPSSDIQDLVMTHSSTRFAVNCHSNVGFLQADSNGVRLVREAMEVEMAAHSFTWPGTVPSFANGCQRLHPPLHLPAEPVLLGNRCPSLAASLHRWDAPIGASAHPAAEKLHERCRHRARDHASLQSQS